MLAYGDIESVNLRTGERLQRVAGEGESRLESTDAQSRHFDGCGYKDDYVGPVIRRRHVSQYERICEEE